MKKGLLFLSVFFFILSHLAHSQAPDTTYWQKAFSFGVNFNQASFDNWAGGGVNSWALGSTLNARALYKKAKWSWDNIADGQLGYVYQNNLGLRKAADQMVLNSAAGYKIDTHWHISFSTNFTNQFAPGYVYQDDEKDSLISAFFAPAQLTLALGISYKPTDWFTARVSPFAPRFTFVLDEDVRPLVLDSLSGQFIRGKAYGVEPGKKARLEWLAFQFQLAINKNLAENIRMDLFYQLFANYETLTIDQVDHRIQLSLSSAITKHIKVSLGGIALYDRDYNNRWQLQQSLAVGLLYSFSTFPSKDSK